MGGIRVPGTPHTDRTSAERAPQQRRPRIPHGRIRRAPERLARRFPPVAPRSDNTPAGWPFVIALLALVGLAIGVHLQLKRHGVPIQTHSDPPPCRPTEELVCTDTEPMERQVRAED